MRRWRQIQKPSGDVHNPRRLRHTHKVGYLTKFRYIHLQVTTTTPGNGYRPPDAAEHWILLTTQTHPPKMSTPPQRRSKAITHDEREGGNATHVPSRTRISPSLSGKKRAVARPLSSSHVQSSGFSVGEEAKASESETGPCSFQVCCCSEAAMNKHRRRRRRRKIDLVCPWARG